MVGPLLETKFHVPRRRRGLIARPELRGRLSRGVESALTLVSAPAGFGKTTLLTEWLAAAPVDGPSAAWLSLDQRDNDPAVFWTYVVTALNTAAAQTVGAGALSLLQSPQPPIEAVLATLLNDLHAVSGDVVLVLDDYHVIEAPDVHDGLAFLLEHRPPQLQLVIATRADPPLPLARLRARGELVEIRVADLRFTPDEAATYLNGAMSLALTPRDVTALEGRTEGWIAALQLAALSLQGRDDTAGFIAGFAGDDRYIVDYLVEEVLQRQPPHVRSFLLQTSVLSRLNGALCDAVTGQDGGKAMLETLDRANLFVVPLDDRRRWYRYHHLFAEHGSVTAAARALHYAQPSVSHHLARLQAETGARLVERVGRGIRLTPEGELLARRAAEILGRLDSAEAELAAFAGLRAGRVRVAAFQSALTVWVPPAAAALRRQHPGLELRLVDAHPTVALQWLRDGKIDVAIVFRYDDTVPDDGVRYSHVADDPMYLLSLRRGDTLADHCDAPWIAGCEHCRRDFVDACEAAGFTPQIVYTSDDIVADQALVAAGLGVTTMPGLALRSYQATGVEATALTGYRRRISVATYGAPPDPPATAAFVAALRTAVTRDDTADATS